MALLETQGLTVTFGGLHANDKVNIEIEEGTFVGLIGPNGAGKTTFIDAITGFVPMSDGQATFNGELFNDLSPHERARRGLSRTFQQLELFEDLTVEDNLLAAAEQPKWTDLVMDIFRPGRPSEVADDVTWALETVGLSHTLKMFPSDLSHGQRKLVGVARALAARPKLVLLDEPAAGLDTGESQALGRRLRTLLDHDTTVFLIDHDMGLVLNVCDYIYVLHFGEIIAAGTPEEIRADPAVIAAYLGEEAGEQQAANAQAVRDLTDPDAAAEEAST